MDDKKTFKITVTHGGKSSTKDAKLEIQSDKIVINSDIEDALREDGDLHMIINMSRNDNTILEEAGISSEMLEACQKSLIELKAARHTIETDEWIYNHFYFDAEEKFKQKLLNYSLPLIDEIMWLAEEDISVSTFDGDMHFHYIRLDKNNPNSFRIFSYMTIIDFENYCLENVMEPLTEIISSMDEDGIYKNIKVIGMEFHNDTVDNCNTYTVGFSFDIDYSKEEVKRLKHEHGRD